MSESKKRKKSYYMQSKKQCSGRHLLDVGMTGFLITCNRMEKQAVREAYNILNEYYQLLYEDVKETPKPTMDSAAEVIISNDDDGNNTEIDFDKLINSQVEAMHCKRDGDIPGSTKHRFQAVDTKITNCIFIESPSSVRHPDEIVSRLLMDVSASGNAKSRAILRILPVLGTCRALTVKIEKLVEDVVTDRFPNGTLGTYAIVYKVRCNALAREHIMSCVGRAVGRASPASRVDLRTPQHVISIDVLGKLACVSIVHDFYALKKYNLQELASNKSDINRQPGGHYLPGPLELPINTASLQSKCEAAGGESDNMNVIPKLKSIKQEMDRSVNIDGISVDISCALKKDEPVIAKVEELASDSLRGGMHDAVSYAAPAASS